MMILRAVVADDSALFRRVLSEVLNSFPGVEVVGSASNGDLALKKVRELKPDLLTLDMEMPVLDGLGVLERLAGEKEQTAVIVVSALTKKGGDLTIKALAQGAFDFITKPEGITADQSREWIRAALSSVLKALAKRVEIKNILHRQPRTRTATASPASAVTEYAPAVASGRTVPPYRPIELILIGVSTGGPAALGKLLPELPADLKIPVLIVQHMPEKFTRSLADNLDNRSRLGVREAEDGEVLAPGRVYIAPGGRQMKLVPAADGVKQIKITSDPPENNCKPAVDYLFRSVAANFPGKAMAVILTGMGSDGTLGVRLLRRHGCFTIAQDADSCVVYGMPKSVVEAGVVDEVLPLSGLPGGLSRLREAGACDS